MVRDQERRPKFIAADSHTLAVSPKKLAAIKEIFPDLDIDLDRQQMRLTRSPPKPPIERSSDKRLVIVANRAAALEHALTERSRPEITRYYVHDEKTLEAMAEFKKGRIELHLSPEVRAPLEKAIKHRGEERGLR